MRPEARLLPLAAAAATLIAPMAAAAETVRMDPRAFGFVRRIDNRFQSYNVEMVEITGGRFWRPYARMNERSDTPAGGQALALDPSLFATRPPADLTNRRLRVLAAALGPAYVRVSGSWANSVYFQNDERAPLATPPAGYRGVLTRAQWRGLVNFARSVDARIVTSFAINQPVRDASGMWTPAQAGPLIEYTRSIGGEIHAAELFNEPNLSSRAGGPARYDGPAFARDIAAFRAFAAQAAPRMLIVGPGDVSTANYPIPGAPTTEALLSASPQPRFDIFSYHFYGAVSPRCAPAGSPVGSTLEAALSEGWLARTDTALRARLPLRDRYAPTAPIWLTEVAGAACGGAPWSSTFADTFRYLDQMGRLATQGVDAVFHNTLAASDYGLIDETTHDPRPNYWAALLWRRQMGPTVLDAGAIRPGLHVYAHCLRGRAGGVSILAINTGETPSVVSAPQAAEVYSLTAPTLQSRDIFLNGRPLAMRANRLPAIRPVRVASGIVTLAPASISFIALPAARNPHCRRAG